MVAYLVPEENLGFAYGIMYACQNASITIVPIFVGVLHKHTIKYQHGYLFPGYFFIFWGCISLLLNLGLWYQDYYHLNSKLQKPIVLEEEIKTSKSEIKNEMK